MNANGSTDLDLLLESLRDHWQALVTAAPRVVFALLVLTAFWIAGRLIARAVTTLLDRSDLAETHLSFFRRVIVWLFVLIGFAVALDIIGLSGVAGGLLAGGGITAVVLGFAFREIGENFLAGFFLAFSRPFNLGDLIQSDGLEGTVRDVSLRSTHIRSADGRDIFIPSSHIFKNPLVNFTRDGLRRHNFRIGIAYQEDTDAACALIEKTILESGLSLETPAPFAGINEFTPNYIELIVRFWVDAFDPAPNVASQRAEIMARCRRTLLASGYTLSADVSQNVTLMNHEAP
ncbi:MAG: mechanosensitive ion channel [Gammaproteobacteria bacterium]|nr:mechanosensitive ion channel [Gammaproteobacteria bacterium]